MPLFAKTHWVPGLPADDNHYYDEPVPIPRLTKKKSDECYFPPDGIDLSDAWVIKIIEADLTGHERGEKYPAVFGVKGHLRRNYVHKGKAAKVYSEDAGCWVYQVGFNRIQFFGIEGVSQNYSPAVDRGPVTSKSTILDGDPCYVQDNKYVPQEHSTATKPPKKNSSTAENPIVRSQQYESDDSDSIATTEPTDSSASSGSSELSDLSDLSQASDKSANAAEGTKCPTKRKRGGAVNAEKMVTKKQKCPDTDPVEEDTVKENTVEKDTVEKDTVKRGTVKGDTVKGDTVKKDAVEKDTVEKGPIEEEDDGGLLQYNDPKSGEDAVVGKDSEDKASEMERQLAMAERKYVSLVMITERVHGVLNPLLGQIKRAHELLHSVEKVMLTVRSPTKGSEAESWNENLEAVCTFVATNGDITRTTLEPCNEKLKDVKQTMPVLYRRITTHGYGGATPQSLSAWALEEGSKFLED